MAMKESHSVCFPPEVDADTAIISLVLAKNTMNGGGFVVKKCIIHTRAPIHWSRCNTKHGKFLDHDVVIIIVSLVGRIFYCYSIPSRSVLSLPSTDHKAK